MRSEQYVQVVDTDSKVVCDTSMKSVAIRCAPYKHSMTSVIKCAQCKDYAYYKALIQSVYTASQLVEGTKQNCIKRVVHCESQIVMICFLLLHAPQSTFTRELITNLKGLSKGECCKGHGDLLIKSTLQTTVYCRQLCALLQNKFGMP